MKINLIFFLSEFVIGGAGNSIFKLCKNLSKKKYNIAIISLNRCYYKKELVKCGISVYEVKSSKTIFAMSRSSDFSEAWSLACTPDITFIERSISAKVVPTGA